MAAIITLSDSDDSDDLPCFADRVKHLINAEKEETNRKCSPLKRNSSQVHSISDSEDSIDTIPFNRERSTSPICSSPELPKFNFSKQDKLETRNDLHNISNKKASPICSSPEFSKFNFGKTYDSKINDDYNNMKNKILSPDFELDIQENTVNRNDDSWNDLPSLNHNSESLSSLPSLSSNPKCNTDVNDHYLSSDEGYPIKKITKKLKEKRDNKDAEKEMRKKIRLEKQKEKEFMKALKASEKEILKSKKPEECLKNMKIVLDHDILYLEDSQIAINFLDQNNLNYSIEENLCKHSVNWYRKVVNICTENQEILRQEREELAETLLVIIPNEEFLKMVHAYVQKEKGKGCDNVSLAEFVINVKSLYPGCDITCVTIGFSKYMKLIKDGGSPELKTIAKQVHKNASEEAVIELQLQSPINFKFLDDMNEFGSLLQHFTKAIAEAPQRKEKQMQKALAFSWYAESDSHCPIKLAKDRSSFIKLWRQQIQQFQNVGQEVAEAIVSRYPSPRLLLKAYNNCFSTKDAENVLQDIVVRRNYGPLGTQKRIGPELSYKLYLFFTSRDGNKLLKR